MTCRENRTSDRTEQTDVTGAVAESIRSSAVSHSMLVLAFVRVRIGESGFTETVPFVFLIPLALVRLRWKGQSQLDRCLKDLRLS